MEYKRQISTFQIFLLTLGAMMGSGWLLSPYYTAKAVGTLAWLCWLIATVLMSVLIYIFAKLVSKQPKAGSMVWFAFDNYGRYLGFCFGGIAWLAMVCAIPIEVLALLQYSSNYLPLLKQAHSQAFALSHFGLASAVVLLWLITWINLYGVKVFSVFGSVLVILKTLVPIVVIIALLTLPLKLNHLLSPQHVSYQQLKLIFMALASAGVIYSFIGFNAGIQLAGEVNNPSRAMPVALIGALLFASLVYIGLQLSYQLALPDTSLTQGWHHLHYTGVNGPIAGLFAHYHYSTLNLFIYFDALISPFCAALIFTGAVGRTAQSLAAIKFFPEFMAKVDKRGVPKQAMIINFLISLLFLLPFPSWHKIVGTIAGLVVFVYGIGPLALIRQDRTLKTIILTIIGFAVVAGLVASSGWNTLILIGLCVVMTSVRYWRLSRSNS